MTPSNKGPWLLAYLALGTVWGCSFLFIKWSLIFLTPFGVAFVRCALGALTLFVLLLASRLRYPRELAAWGHLVVVALCLNVVPGVLFAVAETRTTSILAGIINAMTPLTSLFFIAVVFRDEAITRNQVIGLGLGLVGVLVVLGVWNGLGKNPWWAIAALLVSVTMYGVSYPYSKRHLTRRGLPSESLAAAQLLVASLILLPTFLVHGLNGHHASTKAVLGAAALGVLGSGIAYVWNFQIISNAGSSLASTVTFLTPVVAVIVGLLFLHESFAWFEPVGGAVVLFGAAVGQGRVRAFRRSPSAP
ncbi:MAG: DMT family transporter [Acidimicrobiales bacterium]